MGNFCSDPDSFERRRSADRGSNSPTARNGSAIKNFGKASSVKFEIQTWKTQTLPDLRNQQIASKSQYTFSQEGQLIYSQAKDNITFIPKKNEKIELSGLESELSYNKNPKSVLSMNIQKNLGRYELTFANEFIYELVNSSRQIVEGDRILLGGTEYKFMKVIHDPRYGPNKVKKMSEIRDPALVRTNDYLKSFSNIPDENPSCRICLAEQTSREDPLICPCNCTGSVKYFHLKCWISWSFSSEISQDGLYIGNVIKEQCELCKASLLQDQHYRERVAALLSSVAKINTPFIVLEGLKPLENFPYYSRTKLNYLILSFADKKKYTIGRGQGVDIPLEIDSSISRKNTALEMKNNKIYIEDIGSKHGTYIRIKPPIIIKDDVPKHYLYNNHLFSVKME